MTTPFAIREAAERREAARALLRAPFLTAAEAPEALTLVRRHATALKSTFSALLGYPLVVEASFARLLKAPLTPAAPHRPARRAAGGEFTPRTYTYLALLCAALLAPGTDEQVLASTLVEQLRADAATAGIDLDDSAADQRHMVAAFRQLIIWGVIEETEGSVAAWGERQEEALLTVHRQTLPHLLTRPLATLNDPEQLLAAVADVVDQPRRSLRRKLVENPLVRREELTDAERDVLSRERTELTRVLDDNFGLLLEVRAEGALAFDPEREVTDLDFPGLGTVKQAALLTVDELLRANTPKAGTSTEIEGQSVPGLLCPWPQLTQTVTDLISRHSKAWGGEYVNDPDRLRSEAVAALTAVSLATATDAGLVLHPAAARHRALVEHAPARTRAHTRLDDDTSDTPSLFDPEPTP
jgi:uncharacterized protein (TIGR02678 family)